jgi:hypothetical protein
VSAKLFRIQSARFVAGVVTRELGGERRVAEVPPIVRYMLGWLEAKMLGYCKTKGWTVEEVEMT